MNNIKDILIDIGYSNILDNGKELRMRPIYRDSSSSTVLRVRKDNGCFVDFSRGISGSFDLLVQMSLKLKSVEDAKEWMKGKRDIGPKSAIDKPTVKAKKRFSKDTLKNLIHNNSYWSDRGVPESTLHIFKGGVAISGKMKDRYVFPIFDYGDNLVGLSGRYIKDIPEGSKIPKWKHMGNKRGWKYPLQVNANIINKTKEIILIESIGDMLSLWSAGIKNTMVTFGVEISTAIINSALRFDPDKITISLNDDKDTNSAGNVASQKAKNKLLKYFDSGQVEIKLPTKNDFGDMSEEDIRSWASK